MASLHGRGAAGRGGQQGHAELEGKVLEEIWKEEGRRRKVKGSMRKTKEERRR